MTIDWIFVALVALHIGVDNDYWPSSSLSEFASEDHRLALETPGDSAPTLTLAGVMASGLGQHQSDVTDAQVKMTIQGRPELDVFRRLGRYAPFL